MNDARAPMPPEPPEGEPRRAARLRMESRFGPPGSGTRRLAIAGTRYTLPELMGRLGLAFEDCRTIDGFQLGPGHFAVRFYDAEEQRIVAYEFDAEFRYLAELRVHIAEWVGEEGLAPGGTLPEAAADRAPEARDAPAERENIIAPWIST